MDNCKYIMINQVFPVLFHASIKHDQIARGLGGKVTSAGFCKLTSEGVCCYGKSQSLNKIPDNYDSRLIEDMLKNI